jgi:hypothetical protein
MKTISRIAIGAAVVLMVAATLQPAEAACAAPRLMDNVGAYLVANPDWGGAGGSRTCTYTYGCYDSESLPPVSDSIDGVFWGFNTNTGTSAANPAFGVGIDNGAWAANNGTSSSWIKHRASGGYAYPAFLTLDLPDDTSNGGSGNPINWSVDARIDGCTNDIEPNTCTCFLLTDQLDGIGYFMIDSAISNAIGNYEFNGFPGDAGGNATIKMAPIPAPAVTMSERDVVTGDVTLMVDGGSLAGADYRDAGCDCGVGYIVYQQIVGRGGMAPIDRTITPSTWIPAPSATGGPQAATPFGQQASVRVDCDPAVQQDLYLATAIVEANGLITNNLSANSFRIECGANLAEPNRPDRDRGRSGDAPRGRDNNRGQRDR